MKLVERIRQWTREICAALTPSDFAWKGAAYGVMALVMLLVTAYFAIYVLQDFAWQKTFAFIVSVGVVALVGWLLLVLTPWILRIHPLYRLAMFVFVPFLAIYVAVGNDKQALSFTAATVVFVSFLGAGIAVFMREGFYPRGQRVTLAVTVIGALGIVGGLYAIFSTKESPHPVLDEYVLNDRTLALENPGLVGPFSVLNTSYGSGKDLRRAEFGEDVGIVSRSVDGSKLIGNWDGFTGWLRSSFWGFDSSALPLQARVWYPEGEGQYPLVLIVHGNHSMEDFSDPGYAYLGELFASRGIIFASVDENFLNSSYSARVNFFADRPGIKEENDARGWLLLEHLRQWRDWNDETGHVFFNKVDIDRVALIGHSRGGEAVAIAAAFNSLDRYPDDATLDFDFGFNLRGVIAIAPVDGQYRPRGNGTPIRDVNYFTVHGSMDGDVQSFDGTAQYSRVRFSGDEFRFRSSLYVTGANHGQFNTTWGNQDTSFMSAWALDKRRIMDGEAQRDVARVFFSAFMEVVLRDRHEYLPIFSDVRKAAAWIPSIYYISQFSSTVETPIADFEEDIDPVSMSLPGGRIETHRLSKWYEVANSLKYARRISRHETHAAVFAWDDRFSPEPAAVAFVIPDDALSVDDDSIISASLSAAGVGTTPENWEPLSPVENGTPREDDDAPLDWTVIVTDSNGTRSSLPLSHDEALYPQVKAVPRRASFLDGTDESEVLFRRFEFPLADFVAAEPGFDSASLASIEFVFDRSPRGAVIVDDISVNQPL